MPQQGPPSRIRSVVGEFVIIVAGVLVALGVDEWRDNLGDQRLEAEYIERLRLDLEVDTATFAWFEQVLEAKEAVLRDLVSENPIDRLQAHENLIGDLVYSEFKALPTAQTSTFRELQSTGNLKLLRNVDLRGKISEYHLGFDHISGILATPEGEYRRIFSESFRGDAFRSWRIDSIPPDPAVLESEIRTLLAHPGLEPAVNAELGYTAGMAFYLGYYSELAEALLTALGEPEGPHLWPDPPRG
ncbi:hypothetical protein ACFL5A_04550 [Gemmatimonadota bacterium]